MRSHTSLAGRVRSMVREVSLAPNGRDCSVARCDCVAHPASAIAIVSTNSRRQFIAGQSKIVLPFPQTGEDIYFRGQLMPGMGSSAFHSPLYPGTQEGVGFKLKTQRGRQRWQALLTKP